MYIYNFIAAIHEIQMRAVHLSSEADCLSRWHLGINYKREFYELVSHVPELKEDTVDDNMFKLVHDR